MDQQVHGAQQRWNLCRRDKPREDEPIRQTRVLDLPLQRLSEYSIADQQKSHVRELLDDALCRPDQELVSLQGKQSGDLPDDDLIVGKPELRSHLLAVLVGVQERVDIHAAIDGRELLAPRHTGVNQ
jgi:hypothetical protein